MSHTVQVNLVGDGVLYWKDRPFLIADVKSVIIGEDCTIRDIYLEPEPPEETYTGLLSEEFGKKGGEKP